MSFFLLERVLIKPWDQISREKNFLLELENLRYQLSDAWKVGVEIKGGEIFNIFFRFDKISLDNKLSSYFHSIRNEGMDEQ